VCAITLQKEVIALLDPINPILKQTKNIVVVSDCCFIHPFYAFACNILLYFDYLGRSTRSFTYDEKAIIE